GSVRTVAVRSPWPLGTVPHPARRGRGRQGPSLLHSCIAACLDCADSTNRRSATQLSTPPAQEPGAARAVLGPPPVRRENPPRTGLTIPDLGADRLLRTSGEIVGTGHRPLGPEHHLTVLAGGLFGTAPVTPFLTRLTLGSTPLHQLVEDGHQHEGADGGGEQTTNHHDRDRGGGERPTPARPVAIGIRAAMVPTAVIRIGRRR